MSESFSNEYTPTTLKYKPDIYNSIIILEESKKYFIIIISMNSTRKYSENTKYKI